jgi:hypothetical protein
MSWTLLDFTCKSLEGESFGHMFCRTSEFCCWLSHKSYKGNYIDPEYWNVMCPSPIAHYSRDENGIIICTKPCKFCIMDFILKRFVHIIITRYRRVKKYKQYLLNIKNLRNRELTGR